MGGVFFLSFFFCVYMCVFSAPKKNEWIFRLVIFSFSKNLRKKNFISHFISQFFLFVIKVWWIRKITTTNLKLGRAIQSINFSCFFLKKKLKTKHSFLFKNEKQKIDYSFKSNEMMMMMMTMIIIIRFGIEKKSMEKKNSPLKNIDFVFISKFKLN